jgi:hypothetical protein
LRVCQEAISIVIEPASVFQGYASNGSHIPGTPNNALQPTPSRRVNRADFDRWLDMIVFPIYHGGPAERRRWAGTSGRCVWKPAHDSTP